MYAGKVAAQSAEDSLPECVQCNAGKLLYIYYIYARGRARYLTIATLKSQFLRNEKGGMKEMSLCNVKLFEYVDGQQIRIYKNPIQKKEERKKKEPCMTMEHAQEFLDMGFDVPSWEEFKKLKSAGFVKGNIMDEWENVKEIEKIMEKARMKKIRASEQNKMSEKEKQELKKRSIKNSKSRTVQHIYHIARGNTWEWFVTITFDPRKVDRGNYDDVVKHLSNWLKNIKKRYAPNLTYLLVPELHKDKKNFHFHGLFSNIGDLTLIDSGLRKNEEIIYNILEFQLGFTNVTAVLDNAKVCSYISKYITKELCSVTDGKKRYWCSRNINRVSAKEFNMTPEELETMKDSVSEYISFMKTDCVPFNKVTYLELKNE